MPTRRVPEREKGILSAPGWGRGGRPWPAVTVRDSRLFREVMCMESRTVTQCCSGSAWRNILKVEQGRAGQGRCSICPASKGKGLWTWFAPTKCSGTERSERCTARGFLGPSPVQLAGLKLCRVEFRTLSV